MLLAAGKAYAYTDNFTAVPALGGDDSSVVAHYSQTAEDARISLVVTKPVTGQFDLHGRVSWAHDIEARDSGISTLTPTHNIPYAIEGQKNWYEGGVTGVYKVTPDTRFVADLGFKTGNAPEPDMAFTIGVKIGF